MDTLRFTTMRVNPVVGTLLSEKASPRNTPMAITSSMLAAAKISVGISGGGGGGDSSKQEIC